ncbi:MAG: hypothetical protein NT070_00740 [Cyanobacteria bacterium]|nr:hypothetical protein [Cyanobacteriota bacterium]
MRSPFQQIDRQKQQMGSGLWQMRFPREASPTGKGKCDHQLEKRAIVLREGRSFLLQLRVGKSDRDSRSGKCRQRSGYIKLNVVFFSSLMLNVSEALQQAEFTTNADGQSIAQVP